MILFKRNFQPYAHIDVPDSLSSQCNWRPPCWVGSVAELHAESRNTVRYKCQGWFTHIAKLFHLVCRPLSCPKKFKSMWKSSQFPRVRHSVTLVLQNRWNRRGDGIKMYIRLQNTIFASHSVRSHWVWGQQPHTRLCGLLSHQVPVSVDFELSFPDYAYVAHPSGFCALCLVCPLPLSPSSSSILPCWLTRHLLEFPTQSEFAMFIGIASTSHEELNSTAMLPHFCTLAFGPISETW